MLFSSQAQYANIIIYVFEMTLDRALVYSILQGVITLLNQVKSAMVNITAPLIVTKLSIDYRLLVSLSKLDSAPLQLQSSIKSTAWSCSCEDFKYTHGEDVTHYVCRYWWNPPAWRFKKSIPAKTNAIIINLISKKSGLESRKTNSRCVHSKWSLESLLAAPSTSDKSVGQVGLVPFRHFRCTYLMGCSVIR